MLVLVLLLMLVLVLVFIRVYKRVGPVGVKRVVKTHKSVAYIYLYLCQSIDIALKPEAKHKY